MSIKNYVDSQCPRCNGVGHYPHNPWHICPRCNGTGSIGSFETMPDILPQFQPTQFSKSLRVTRERRKLTLRELSCKIGVSPSRLSELENGLKTPTPEEEKTIREWMEAKNEPYN